jgi:hypothetical protein
MNIEVSFIVPHKGVEFIVDENGKAEPIAITAWLDHAFKDTEHLYNWLSREVTRCTKKIGSGQFRDIVDLNRITKQQHTIVLLRKHKLRYGVRYIFTVSKA